MARDKKVHGDHADVGQKKIDCMQIDRGTICLSMLGCYYSTCGRGDSDDSGKKLVPSVPSTGAVFRLGTAGGLR